MRNNTRNNTLFFIFLLAFWSLPIHADDTDIAEKYFQWAQKAVDEGRWESALVGLERASDFAECSSDISYLFAVALLREKQSRDAALTAVKLALETDEWRRYSREQGLLLQANIEVGLHRFQTVFSLLNEVSDNVEEAYIKLLAYKGLEDWSSFTVSASTALEKYPTDVRIARIILEAKFPDSLSEVQHPLIEKILKRLPVLLKTDPELAYIAAPFIPDTDEARRLIAAYRAIHAPTPASIPSALNFGVIDGKTAIDELFNAQTIDKNLILSVWSLLRDDDSRKQIQQSFLSYSGLITEDKDRDGLTEIQVKYDAGRIAKFSCDEDFDGIFETIISFEDGVPISAKVRDMQVVWEQYPAVSSVLVNGSRYVLKPNDFFFMPLKLNNTVGVLYPEVTQTILMEKVLANETLFIERDSNEFIGAVDRIEIENGIPIRSREFLDGRIVSETTFKAGKPVSEVIDLDLDGIMETKRVF
jgi:tetratricopeptide (TPR) repeat protein